jgi:hypothetical protein
MADAVPVVYPSGTEKVPISLCATTARYMIARAGYLYRPLEEPSLAPQGGELQHDSMKVVLPVMQLSC